MFSYSAAGVPLTAIGSREIRIPGQRHQRDHVGDARRARRERHVAGEHYFLGYGLDLATTYSVPVWKNLRPWLKFEFYNVLNNQKQIKWDTTVTADATSPKDANGLATGFIKGANFGKATADNQFPQPVPGTNGGRLFRMAFGLRF